MFPFVALIVYLSRRSAEDRRPRRKERRGEILISNSPDALSKHLIGSADQLNVLYAEETNRIDKAFFANLKGNMDGLIIFVSPG